MANNRIRKIGDVEPLPEKQRRDIRATTREYVPMTPRTKRVPQKLIIGKESKLTVSDRWRTCQGLVEKVRKNPDGTKETYVTNCGTEFLVRSTDKNPELCRKCYKALLREIARRDARQETIVVRKKSGERREVPNKNHTPKPLPRALEKTRRVVDSTPHDVVQEPRWYALGVNGFPIRNTGKPTWQVEAASNAEAIDKLKSMCKNFSSYEVLRLAGINPTTGDDIWKRIKA